MENGQNPQKPVEIREIWDVAYAAREVERRITAVLTELSRTRGQLRLYDTLVQAQRNAGKVSKALRAAYVTAPKPSPKPTAPADASTGTVSKTVPETKPSISGTVSKTPPETKSPLAAEKVATASSRDKNAVPKPDEVIEIASLIG
jgi:hypothetical protein